MQKTRGEIFDERRPTLTEGEVAHAARADRVVVSFNALPVLTDPSHIGALGVKLSLGDGTTATVIMDPHACTTFRMIVEALDAAQWRASVSAPPDATQH